ncbi:Uncharacterised protein [Mycobacteroides abscessus subsp. abscessus]|nr:Uncharacterised protein [Mycobacteroides abscessus subsp. abscessus]
MVIGRLIPSSPLISSKLNFSMMSFVRTFATLLSSFCGMRLIRSIIMNGFFRLEKLDNKVSSYCSIFPRRTKLCYLIFSKTFT